MNIGRIRMQRSQIMIGGEIGAFQRKKKEATGTKY